MYVYIYIHIICGKMVMQPVRIINSRIVMPVQREHLLRQGNVQAAGTSVVRQSRVQVYSFMLVWGLGCSFCKWAKVWRIGSGFTRSVGLVFGRLHGALRVMMRRLTNLVRCCKRLFCMSCTRVNYECACGQKPKRLPDESFFPCLFDKMKMIME